MRRPPEDAPGWMAYRDEGGFVPPSTARDRMRPSTTSMSEEVIKEMEEDKTRPLRAQAASRELRRRAE